MVCSSLAKVRKLQKDERERDPPEGYEKEEGRQRESSDFGQLS